MSTAKFTAHSLPVATLIGNIDAGLLGLPELQRPFVWDRSQVRDLLDSLYRGYPAGHFLFWKTQPDQVATQIGVGAKATQPTTVVVDGQQRLTSLYAVFTGSEVLSKTFVPQRIRIAFNPVRERFEVNNKAIENDVEWISDISELLGPDVSTFAFTKSYLDRLRSQRDLSDADEAAIAANLSRLESLKGYTFNVIELSNDLPVDEVGEIFVRVNSKGTTLTQADFILTLMSVYWPQGRDELEAFCAAARTPSKSAGSPFNWFIEPEPDQLLRVAIGLGHRRAQLRYAYELLRGKDLATGEVSAEIRSKHFDALKAAQAEVLDLSNWSQFMTALQEAGYRSGSMITSRNAIIYTYLVFLIGRHDYSVELTKLRSAVARWFFMVMLTSRYSGSSETQVEKDMRRFEEATNGEEFLAILDSIIHANLTGEYWELTLPDQLAYSGGFIPASFAYQAALNLLGAKALFSNVTVYDLLDPANKGKKGLVDRHHLFPKGYLKSLGITRTARVNQAANYALVEWPTNIAISDAPPAEYFPGLWSKLSPQEADRQQFLHALPSGWESMEYDKFLEERRRLMAKVVKAGFDKLATGVEVSVSGKEAPLPPSLSELIADGESLTVEFKASIAHSYREGVPEAVVQAGVLKTIAALLNTDGGTLVIGVEDSGTILGIEPDFELKNLDKDRYENMLSTLIMERIDKVAVHRCSIRFENHDGATVCIVDVLRSPKPVYARLDKGKEKFFVRVGNTTREYETQEAVQYIKDRWGLGN